MGISRKLGNLGTALDSGSLSNFLTTNNIEGLFRDVTWTDIANKPTTLDSAAAISYIDSAYIQARQTDIGLESAEITSLVDSAYISARQITTGIDSAGVIGIVDSAYLEARVSGGLDSGAITNLIDSAYVGSKAAVNSGFNFFMYEATAGQTIFQDSDLTGKVLEYIHDGTLVFYNGVLLDENVDYSVYSTGDQIVLSEAAESGASVAIGKWALLEGRGGGNWYGDRAISTGYIGGHYGSGKIDYWNMASSSNSTEFGARTVGLTRVASCSNGTRVVFAGGYLNESLSPTIDYVTASTTGNATDFGDLSSDRYSMGGLSDGTYGVFGGGVRQALFNSPRYTQDTIEYITIATTGNAEDFGNLSGNNALLGSCANDTYGLFAGGESTWGGTQLNKIERIAVAFPGNSSDFGDLSSALTGVAGCSDTTRGVFAGGLNGTAFTYDIQYVTISSPGNASDFGDLILNRNQMAGVSNGTVGHFAGGYDGAGSYMIQQITIQTLGNASDFGDILGSGYAGTASSGSSS